MTEEKPATPGLLLSDDMIFTSRIVGTARGLGLALSAARSTDALLKLAGQSTPPCVIVDLDNPGLDLPVLMHALGEIAPRPRVVAYGPHVNAELLHAAREAGCDLVLPRSKFVEQLVEALPGWFK
jgi:DNA-binding NarL/FixJ family response regulator